VLPLARPADEQLRRTRVAGERARPRRELAARDPSRYTSCTMGGMRFERRHRRLTRSALALIAVFSVLASLVLGGHRYFHCAQMNEASFDACCAPPSGAASDDGPSIEPEACCKAEHFALLGPSVTPHHEAMLSAPLLAILPVASPSSAPRMPAVVERARTARAGPAAPDARRHRLRLMVFLT